jgi:HNH endonuclease
MVWNKTPEHIVEAIYEKLREDFSITYKEISILFNVSEWLVSETWRAKASKEEKKQRYSDINKQAKLGNKNPQFGKYGLDNHKAKNVVISCGYKTVWQPLWWEGHSPKNGRCFEHQLIWCIHNNVTHVPKGHIIHHKDHNKLNNDPTNLELMSRSAHMTYHATERATTRHNAVGNSVPEVQSVPSRVGDIV